MKIANKVKILSTLTTRDNANRHFTHIVSGVDLAELEREGLISINRPIHPTGIPYAEEYHSVSVTAAGADLVDANAEYCG